jgi:hypothetical protein
LVCFTASPTRLPGDGTQLDNQIANYEHYRTYTYLLNNVLLYSNRVRFKDGVNFWGSSFFHISGREIIAVAKVEEVSLIFVEFDSVEVQGKMVFSSHSE